MPLTTVGPAPFRDPPCAFNPFVVEKDWLVLNSQMILPVRASYARRYPSSDPANTTPAIAVGGAIFAALQPKVVVQAGFGGGANQTFFPV